MEALQFSQQVDVEASLKPTASKLPANSEAGTSKARVLGSAWYPVFFEVMLSLERAVI